MATRGGPVEPEKSPLMLQLENVRKELKSFTESFSGAPSEPTPTPAPLVLGQPREESQMAEAVAKDEMIRRLVSKNSALQSEIHNLRSLLQKKLLADPKPPRRQAKLLERLATPEFLRDSEPPPDFVAPVSVKQRSSQQATVRKLNIKLQRAQRTIENLASERDKLSFELGQLRVASERMESKYRSQLTGTLRRTHFVLEEKKKLEKAVEGGNKYIRKLEAKLVQVMNSQPSKKKKEVRQDIPPPALPLSAWAAPKNPTPTRPARQKGNSVVDGLWETWTRARAVDGVSTDQEFPDSPSSIGSVDSKSLLHSLVEQELGNSPEVPSPPDADNGKVGR